MCIDLNISRIAVNLFDDTESYSHTNFARTLSKKVDERCKFLLKVSIKVRVRDYLNIYYIYYECL